MTNAQNKVIDGDHGAPRPGVALLLLAEHRHRILDEVALAIAALRLVVDLREAPRSLRATATGYATERQKEPGS